MASRPPIADLVRHHRSPHVRKADGRRAASLGLCRPRLGCGDRRCGPHHRGVQPCAVAGGSARRRCPDPGAAGGGQPRDAQQRWPCRPAGRVLDRDDGAERGTRCRVDLAVPPRRAAPSVPRHHHHQRDLLFARRRSGAFRRYRPLDHLAGPAGPRRLARGRSAGVHRPEHRRAEPRRSGHRRRGRPVVGAMGCGARRAL